MKFRAFGVPVLLPPFFAAALTVWAEGKHQALTTAVVIAHASPNPMVVLTSKDTPWELAAEEVDHGDRGTQA